MENCYGFCIYDLKAEDCTRRKFSFQCDVEFSKYATTQNKEKKEGNRYGKEYSKESTAL